MRDIESLIGNRDEFPILREWNFFNHAGVTAIAKCGADALRAYAAQAESAAYVGAGWYAQLDELRAMTAKLINAHEDEIALVKNTSEGIATVARGVKWNAGDRIVTASVEYPANVYPWMDVARRENVELVMVAEESDTQGRRFVPIDKILQAAEHPRTRMIALSHVEFASGQRLDVARIGKFCRERGVLFCLDAIQTLGIIPVDVVAMDVDYLSADGHKWLLGPEGAGVFYIRRELLESTHPPEIGWNNVVHAQDFGSYNFTFRADAQRYESGTPNVPGFLALHASMQMLMDIGVENISRRIKKLTDQLADGVEAKGYQLISPREGEMWSGSVVFVSPTHDHAAVVAKLRKEHKTEVALREGRIRCSPHIYNTEAQIARFIDVLPGH
jgi:cysteine desulfurase / selenocysteine lyase